LKKPTYQFLNLEERIGYGIYEKTINWGFLYKRFTNFKWVLFLKQG
jgi:hypothetical protein